MHELVGKVNEAVYNGNPLRMFEGTFQTLDNRLGERAFPVKLAIHPNLSRRIIVNVPGTRGEIDGYAEKYKILAHHMQSQGLGAVVRTGNDFTGFRADVNLNAALEYAKEHAVEICGEPEPEILLMGFSAGASAIAARAHYHSQVSKILLGAPATSMDNISVRDGIAKFNGEVYIIIGDSDDNVGTQSGQIIFDWATSASHKELLVLPNCDHQFRGEGNGRIISEAPFYAFAKGEKPLFPDPKGGIKLYD